MHLFPSAYKGQVCKKIPRNCGAFAPYFFRFLACSLHRITQKSIEHRIACNCGAFAPYFFCFPFLPWKSDDEMSFNKFILISLALHLADNGF